MEAPTPQLPQFNVDFPGNTILDSKYLSPDYLFDKEVSFVKNIISFITDEKTLDVYTTLLFALAMFFIAVILYSFIRILEIRSKEKKHLKHEIEEYAQHQREKEHKLAEGESVSKNERWRMVLHLLFSPSQNDWKLAIVEADAMLEALLGDLGYKGESLGDRLKIAGEQGFRQLDSAWEVHTIRNRIAHEGTTFELSHREAKRFVALYEQIFREFGYI